MESPVVIATSGLLRFWVPTRVPTQQDKRPSLSSVLPTPKAMTNRFLAIDVETSNSDRSSICQVGWVLFENGSIVSEFSSLVNPHSAFLPRNIKVHGIRPQDVANAPSFAEIYPLLIEACDNEIVVHHGDFDWQSICHAAYLEGFELPNCSWLNTRNASQGAWPHLPNLKLNTLCEELGIDLLHHDALEDARACGQVFKALCKANLFEVGMARRVVPEDVAHYTHRHPKTGLPVEAPVNGKKLMLTVEKGLGELDGFLRGILADNRIDTLELTELDEWVRANHDWMSRPPWDELISLIDDIDDASDGEHSELLHDLMWLTNRLGRKYFEGQAIEIRQLEGIFRGVLADGALTDDEVHAIEAWIREHNHLEGHFLFDGISTLVADVLEDGIITETERTSLVKFMLDFTSNIGGEARAQFQSDTSNGVTHAVYSRPDIRFDAQVFCLSGDFECFESKKEVENRISALGGAASKGITKKVAYLVVGGAGSADWKFGKYGRKVEKALDYRAKGVHIDVIEEAWLVSQLEGR